MVDATLRRLYYSLNEPSSYSGVQRLYEAAKKHRSSITKTEVENWLTAQDSYTLHRPARRKLNAEPSVKVKHIDDQWAIDLCDMSNIARENDGNRYILTCIDVLSKFAWVETVKTKTGENVTSAFKKILQRTQRRPKRIESDRGKEFYNRTFRTVVDSIGAEHFSTNSRHKASVVERFNRSLKQLIYKVFTARNTVKWIDTLQDVVNIYNSRKHRSIQMAPNKVSHANEKLIWKRLYGRKKPSGRRYPVGQLVRISKIKQVFEKGYLPNYTEEVFRIARVHVGRPHRYQLEDMMGELLEGKFVSEELTPVTKNQDDLWKVEKVLKRDKKGRYYVKWLGFPTKFNSWVDTIVQI